MAEYGGCPSEEEMAEEERISDLHHFLAQLFAEGLETPDAAPRGVGRSRWAEFYKLLSPQERRHFAAHDRTLRWYWERVGGTYEELDKIQAENYHPPIHNLQLDCC